jgi:hypothetical protein
MAHASHLKTALIGAAVLSLALAVPASAAPATSAQVSDSVTVNETLSLVLNTSSIVYEKPGGGPLDPGMTSTGQGILITAGANRPWHVSVTGTDLWSAEGNMIPATQRYFENLNLPFTQGMWVLSSGGGQLSENAYIRITVPGDQPGGSYSGTMTFVISAP